MAHEITVPRLGWSMEEGTFVRWLKAEGEFVRAGEPLFELESDKATQEIESLDSGILRLLSGTPQPGSVVKVGALLGYLVAEGEQAPLETAPPAQATSVPTAKNQPRTHVRPGAAPSVRRLARELGVPLESLQSANIGRRISAEEVRAKAMPPDQRGRNRRGPIASPRARRAAAQLGIDWRELTGTGKGGRIRERDVRLAAQANPDTVGGDVGPRAQAQPLSPRRRTIAARMLASHQQTAPVTLTSVADATNLVNLRGQFQAAGSEIIPSYTDLVIKVVAGVLARHPMLAARWESERLRWAKDIDIGIAVDTEQGLLVPVIQRVSEISILDLARRSRELIERARAGKLTAAEMQGGVFTVTNLGSYGIDAFTPLIHLPEVAILGLGTIRREAVVIEGDRIVARDRMTLSLTFDHRAVDGAPAARFLRDARQAIENPSAWLLAPP